MDKEELIFFDYVKKNSFEEVNINLGFNGGESTPLVKIGSMVSKNMLISAGKGFPNIFAPFSGKVKDIIKMGTDTNNIVSTHIKIERDNEYYQNGEITRNDIKTTKDFVVFIESHGVINSAENSDSTNQ